MMQIPGLYMRPARAALPARRAGLGDATSDLAAFHATVNAGDLYLGAGEWDNAVQAYQAAGNTGATTLGPEIDASTSGTSASLTQQAWTINGQLAAIATPGATQATATNAQGFSHQMGVLYDQAISIHPTLPPAPSPTGSPAPTATWTPAPTQTAGGGGTNYTVPILLGAGVVGLGIVGWAAFKRPKARELREEANRMDRKARELREAASVYAAEETGRASEARLTYRQRVSLPDSAYALPEKRHRGKGGLPLTNKSGRLDPKHIRNAASRLAQMKKRGTVTPDQYTRARRKIIRAACKKGVEKTCRTYLSE